MPEIIVVDVTNKCNLKCKHCHKNVVDAESGTDIDLFLLNRVLEQSEPYKTKIVSLTGGEPTLHNDWEGLIAVMERHDVDYIITSNGINFKEAYELLVRGATSRFRGVLFSLDGATAETNDAIRGEGTFDKVIEAMKLARMHGLPFGVQAVIGTYNVNELPQIAALAAAAGAREFNYVYMRPTMENTEYLLSPMQADQAAEQIGEIKKAHRGMNFGTTARNNSPYPLFACRPLVMKMIGIDYKGHLTFCPDLTNYRGGEAMEMVEDLNGRPLQFALKELSNRVNRFWHNKIDWVMEGTVATSVYDPCLYCLSHFGIYESVEV